MLADKRLGRNFAPVPVLNVGADIGDRCEKPIDDQSSYHLVHIYQTSIRYKMTAYSWHKGEPA